MLHLYFIRHGQSKNNALWDEGGRTNYLTRRTSDPDLTSIGWEQAALAAEFLARPYDPEGFDPQNRCGFGLTHLYCSLMVRAVKTGLVIARQVDLPLRAWPDLHETGGIFNIEGEGEDETFVGLPGPGRSYFEQEFPELQLPDDLGESGWWDREKEPRENYVTRAQRIFDGLRERHTGQDHRVGIITHGGIFARILTVMFDVKEEDYWFLMNNCGISRIDVDDSGHVMLVYMNRVDFLPDALVT